MPRFLSQEEYYNAGVIYGLTGGIGTGKSEAVKIIRADWGYPVLDADAIAREVVAPGTLGSLLLRLYFGNDIYRVSDQGKVELDRRRLGEIVFSDARARRVLNMITHPLVCMRILWRLFLLRNFAQVRKPIVLDVPLLYESGLAKICAVTMVVYASRAQQYERLKRRNPEWSDADIEQRIQAQLPLERKMIRADERIDNRGTKAELREQVAHVLERLHLQVSLRARKRQQYYAIALGLVFATIILIAILYPSETLRAEH
jgi:dephospho-CoA kinase